MSISLTSGQVLPARYLRDTIEQHPTGGIPTPPRDAFAPCCPTAQSPVFATPRQSPEPSLNSSMPSAVNPASGLPKTTLALKT